MSTMYSTCDQPGRGFIEVSDCTKSAIKADSRYSWMPAYQDQANRAIAGLDMLAEKVAAGAMTEKEARYHMQELLASMRQETAAKVNAINAATQGQQSGRVRTNCQIDPYTNTARCVSR